MTQEEIIRMAREAGLVFGLQMYIDHYQLERFATLVAAHEREACAKLCDELQRMNKEEFYAARPEHCAVYIRARGEN